MKALIFNLIKIVLKLLYRVEFINPKNLTINQNRSLIVSNHESFIDGILLGFFLPVHPIFVINTQVANNWQIRYFLKLIDHITIDPSHPMSVKTILRQIESGRPVVIFPEGRITTTGTLMKIYEGPAFIAAKSGACIYPVRIKGAMQSTFAKVNNSGLFPRKFFPKITLTLLSPTKLPVYEGIKRKVARYRASEDLRKVMQNMFFETRPQQTIFSAFYEVCKINPINRKVLEDIRQVEISYYDIIKLSIMLGRLSCKFTQQNTNVGILLPNSNSTLGLFFGLSINRRIPAMLNFTSGIDGLINACTIAKVTTIFTSSAFIEQAKLSDKINSLKANGFNIINLEDLRTQLSIIDKLWWLFYARFFPLATCKKINTEEPAVVLFTSGSEGKPKGVVLSHRALLANVSQIMAIIDIGYKDKLLNSLPMFHSFGLTAGVLLPLLTGAKLYLHPSPLHYRIIPELVYDKACTVLLGTNTFLGHYGKFAHPFDFNTLRYVVAGAEKLTDNVKEMWFEKFGLRIFEGYGTTEAAPVVAVNTPMAYKSGTVGQFLPGINYKLQPIVGINQGGILHINGANLKTGYYLFNNPGVIVPTNSSIGAGWYETGDIVDVDEDGFVKILGRVKRFAKIAGEMISLEVVENIARKASATAQHAVISVADESRGEALILFTTNNNLTREHLQNAAREIGASELSIPKVIKYISEIPVLGTGKTDYLTLKESINLG